MDAGWQRTEAAGAPGESILQLLGEPLWMSGHSAQPVASRKGLALLCYLACQPGVDVSRRHLGSLLWGDFDRGQAASSLATTLSRLRRQVVRWPLASHGDYLLWDPGQGVATDVARFLDGIHGDAPAARVASLVRGRFLTGLEFDDAPLYMDWLTAERQAWHRRSLDVLWAAALEARARGEWSQVLAWSRQALALDALQERFVRTVMVAHAALGDRAACAAAYEGLASRLARQLGAFPDPDTTRLRDGLLRGAPRGKPDKRGRTEPWGAAPPLGESGPPLTGREAEQQQLGALLSQSPVAATLLCGPMGVGKTRLLRAVTSSVEQAWADGRQFVEAGDAFDEAFPWDVWVRQLHLPEPTWTGGGELPWRTLAALPDGRRPVLVLDHAEDLPARRLARVIQAVQQGAAGQARLLVGIDLERLDASLRRAWLGMVEAKTVAVVRLQPLGEEAAAGLAAAAGSRGADPELVERAGGFPLLILAEADEGSRAEIRGRVAEWLAAWPLSVRAVLEMAAVAPAGLPAERLWAGGPAVLDALDRVLATGWLTEAPVSGAIHLAWRAPALAQLIREAMSPSRQAYWAAQLPSAPAKGTHFLHEPRD